MERRIRILYIITIIAILAFLGMQVYWLYGRYRYTLQEYEASCFGTVAATVRELNQDRKAAPDTAGRTRTQQTSYNVDYTTDSLNVPKIRCVVRTQKYYAHELLGIKGNRPLTPEEQNMVAGMLLDHDSLSETSQRAFEVDGSPTEAALWGALKNVDVESLSPLTAGLADSALRAKGLDVRARLAVTDTMEWEPSFLRHATPFHPVAVLSVPYSELERKSIVVDLYLPVARIFKNMAGSLAVVAVLSLFLIICLMLQFATVLKLSRLDRMRNGFVTTMIHELKRPISTLKMCVSGLDNERMITDGEVRRELLYETRNALDRLSAYFSKLRDITFNNVEQIPLNIRNISLRTLFGTVAEATVVPSGKRVRIVNAIGEGMEISADPSHLYNILNNLVENAVKYSGDAVEITGMAEERDGLVEISVRDNGNGIAQSDLRHVFRRFYRGRSAGGEQPGMGLGLAYVRLLVEAHGGNVTVKSVEGKGTCFTIILPQ